MEAFLHHLTVERGQRGRTPCVPTPATWTATWSTWTARGIDDLDAVREQRRRPRSSSRCAAAPAPAGRVVGGPGARRRARAAPVRPARRAGRARTWPARSRPPALPKRLPKALSIDQVEQLLAGCPGDGPAALRDRALLELLYSTGARISEAVGLDVDDLDPRQRTVLLRGKGGKQRIVPVGRPALAAVEAYAVRARPALAARGRGTPALLLNARGGRLSRQSAWHVLRAAAEIAGLTAAVSPHTLRHCFATHLLAGGADVRVVQELLGHASVSTTQIYTHVTVDTLREVYATSHPRARG